MKFFSKQNGFSLVEVIVGLSIVGMIILVIQNLPSAINLVTSSQSDSIVREVAAKKLEDVRIAGYDNLANGTSAISDPRINKLAGVLANMVISGCPVEVCAANEQVKQVRITISWQENGEPKTYQVSTLVAKDGLK